MADLVNSFSHSWPFFAAVLFVSWFPIVSAFLVINSSRQFLLDRQGIVTQRLEPTARDVLDAEAHWPLLSVLISARNEQRRLGACLESVLALRWPRLEIVVVDDGSSDDTRAVLERFRRRGDVTVVSHDRAHGKANSINEAAAASHGGILLVIDADAELTPEVALLLASQLHHHPDLAAVTANPRVLCVDRLIQKLQAIEFSATVAAQRRSHSSWGRVSTMSGICTMFRREAFDDIGGFDPRQPAEDIEMTWRLQSLGWRIAYEPAALVGTHAPSTLPAWIRQRRRWSKGLVYALRTNWTSIVRPSSFTLWPLLAEAGLAMIWCHLLVLLTAFWFFSLAIGAEAAGNSITIGLWGSIAFVACTFQILWGIHLDRPRDRSIGAVAWFTPLYPLFYWMMTAAIAVSSVVPALVRRIERPVIWEPDRAD